MAKNRVSINQIVGDFIVTTEGDDYTSNVSDVVRNHAHRGIRVGLTSRVIKSIKLSVTSTTTLLPLRITLTPASSSRDLAEGLRLCSGFKHKYVSKKMRGLRGF